MLDNPLVPRLIGRSGWPSPRGAVWLAIGLALAILAFTVKELMSWYPPSATLRFLLLTSFGLDALTPVAISLMAVMITVRDVSSEEFQLLNATLLSDEDFVQSYVFATLYRARFLLILMAGLMPVPIVELAWFYPISILGVLPFSIGMWGVVWLAAALGVGLALRQDKLFEPMIFTPVIVVIFSLLFMGITLITSRLSLWICPPIVMLLPFGVAVKAIDYACQWVRRT